MTTSKSSSNELQILPRKFYELKTTEVARRLIGQRLVSCLGGKRVEGIVVETEAYLPRRDSACHATKHRTARTEVMFGRAGVAYVYPIHAKVCFNVVTEWEEQGCAVLIRAVQPTFGLQTIQNRRGLTDLKRLTTGPANLCQAFGIDRSINSLDLTLGNRVWLEENLENRLGINEMNTTIKSSKRIGVTSAKDRLLRFYLADNSFVSGPKRLRT